MAIHTALALLVALSQSEAKAPVNAYAGRNGEAQALADIARGEPARVYYRGQCGESCRLIGVGLLNCEPDEFDTQKAPKGFFVYVPEADADSSVTPTADQQARAVSAYVFAKAYKLTMFRERKREILKQCPRAELGECAFGWSPNVRNGSQPDSSDRPLTAKCGS